jgi:hypothetical protein
MTQACLPPPCFQPTFSGRPEYVENQGLTHKAFAPMLALHGMKNKTKQRLKAAAIAALIVTALLILGQLEQQAGLPNH